MDAMALFSRKGSREIFLTLKKFPKRQFSINELANTACVPFASSWRIVREWDRAGIVSTGKLGRSVTVSYCDSPFSQVAGTIFAAAASPHKVAVGRLKATLKRMQGVKEAYLFGSVARGEEKLESDIDLAILSSRDFDAAGLAMEAYDKMRAKVVPLKFTSKRQLSDFLKGKEQLRLK